MPGWRCFMISPSPYCRRTMRRFRYLRPGEPHLHEASVTVDERLEIALNQEGPEDRQNYIGDPRWPERCPCGYAFTDPDQRQIGTHRLYQGFPDGRLYELNDRDLPVGAMWEAPWLSGHGWEGPDGKSLVVMMPGGHPFPVDCPARDGGKWSRTGTPPAISVDPSIHQVGVYHGHIKDGVITESVDGYQFPNLARTA